MKNSNNTRTLFLAFILAIFSVGYTLAQNKVVVVPLEGDTVQGNAGLSGYEIVSNTISINPSTINIHTLSQHCPVNKKVLGGGGFTGTARHVLSGSFPSGEGAWVIAVTRKGGAATGAATATVYAVCAQAS